MADHALRSILFFVPSLGGGGAEANILRVLRHLDRSRFRVSIAISSDGGSLRSLVPSDVRLHVLGNKNVRSSTGNMILSIPALRDLLVREVPDILHAVLDVANVAAVLATRKLQPVPSVTLNVQNSPFHNHGPLFRLLIRSFFPSAQRVIASSAGVRNELLKIAPDLADRTDVIYNAAVDDVGRTDVSSRVTVQDTDRPLLLACGRLVPQKGYEHLIEALRLIRLQRPANLWILGTGPLRPKLEAQALRCGVAEHVKFLGFRPNPLDFMRSADVFVLSSLWEGFGNVVAEAMSCEVPVVATDCPHGPAEIMRNNEEGLLVQPGNPVALADGVLRLLADRSLAARLSKAGAKRSRVFSSTEAARRYEEFFGRVTGSEREGA